MYRYVMGSGGGLGNLLKASEEFQQTRDWVRYPTNSQTPTVNDDSRPDPNGGTTADQVGLTANTSARLQQTVTLSASTEYTFSVYARAVSGSVDFRMRNVTLKDAEVKTATTTGGDGGGFTRFTYTFTTTTAGSYELALQNDTNATAKDVIFWGAMLNQGGTALDYEYAAPTTGGSAPAPAYAGFGDAFGGVTAYYSLRQFTEAETLNAIRVRRSSDDTEQDIGFDANGDLDTTALLAFVGTGGTDNGFVTTWYDQAGSNHATNSTASEQPLIVDGGTLVQENGKAAITSETEWLSGPISLGEITAFSLFVVGKNKNTTTTNAPLVALNSDGYSSGDRFISIRKLGTEMQFPIFSGSATSTKSFSSLNANQNLYGGFYVEGGLQNTSQNGVLVTGANTLSGIDINSTIDFFAFNNAGSIVANEGGGLQEVIVFDSDQSANRGTVTTGGGTGIEGNINTYFDIV